MNEWLTLYILCWPEVYKAHNKRKSSEQLRMLIFELWTAALTVCLALKSDDVVPLWLCVNYSSLLLHSCSIFPSSGLLPQWEQIAPKINTGISKSLSASLMRTKKKKTCVWGKCKEQRVLSMSPHFCGSEAADKPLEEAGTTEWLTCLTLRAIYLEVKLMLRQLQER